MTKCLACLKNSETFIKLDELRNQRYLEFSTKFYGGLLNTLGKSLEPELMKCKSCNHVFYKNMPSDELLTAMYSYKSPRKNDPSRPPNYNMVKTMHKCFKLIGKTNPIMLDYGAGFGRWSVAGVKAGFKVIAYDPHAERTVKNPDYELFINKKDMPDIEYDFIWCEQVLEHAKDPYAVLKDIKKLKPHHQDIIQLRYFKELSYLEISQKTDIPINNVKVKLLRAKKLLAAVIQHKK